jgi:hypothetical protein
MVTGSISRADPFPELCRAACIPQLRMACQPVREFSVERLDVHQGQFDAADVFIVLLGHLATLLARSESAVHQAMASDGAVPEETDRVAPVGPVRGSGNRTGPASKRPAV